MGMLITLFLNPVGWAGAVVGFLLFRVAGIAKPVPANRLERLPGAVAVVADEGIVARIQERFARRGMTMTDNNRRQAMVPRGAEVLENANGTAPGLWLTRGRTAIALLPGPPREMTPMLDAIIRGRLAPRSGEAGLFRRVLKITGRPESEVDAVAHAVYGKWTTAEVPISTTILAALGQIELPLTARAANRAEADAALDAAVGELQSALGSSIYGTDGRPLEAVLGDLLRERTLRIAV